MSPKIDPAVEKLKENPEGKEVRVLVDVPNDADLIETILAQIDDVKTQTLPFGVLRVQIEDSNLDALCSIERAKSIELERVAYPLG